MKTNIEEKEYLSKNELLKYILKLDVEANEDTVKSFLKRKFSFNLYKNEKGEFRIPLSIAKVVNIIYTYYGSPEWDEFKKPLLNDKDEISNYVLREYEKLLEIVNINEYEDGEKRGIEFILDAITRKSQFEYEKQIENLKRLIVYEANELSYDQTLSIYMYIRDTFIDLLTMLTCYKDKYSDYVDEGVNKNYELPKSQKEMKIALVGLLKEIEEDVYNQNVKAVEEIMER